MSLDLPWSEEDRIWLQGLGLDLDPETEVRLARFHGLLAEANRVHNLTRISGPEDFLRKHALDALAFLAMVPGSRRAGSGSLLDVGTGGGLPGIPLLLLLPGWRGVLLDATRKKADAVQGFLDALDLADRAETAWGRVEDPACMPGRVFDLVVARAVKAMPLLIGWCAPRVAPGGMLVVSKEIGRAHV